MIAFGVDKRQCCVTMAMFFWPVAGENLVFSLIGTLVVGLIVGALAKFLMPGKDPGGFLITILLGIAGAFIARFIGSKIFGWYGDGGAPGWIASILGAMLLLWIYRMIRSRS